MSISPNVPSSQESYHYESSGTPRWISVLFALLFVALGAVGFFAYSSTSKLTKDLTDAQKTNTTLSAQLDQANTRLAELKSIVEVTQQKVGMTASEVAQAKSRADFSGDCADFFVAFGLPRRERAGELLIGGDLFLGGGVGASLCRGILMGGAA